MPIGIFIGNLPWAADWKYVKDLCRDAGVEVIHANVPADPITGKPKGFATVQVTNEEDIDMAIDQLSNQTVDGRKLIVREDREPQLMEKGKGKGKESKGSSFSKGGGKGDWHGGKDRWNDRPAGPRPVAEKPLGPRPVNDGWNDRPAGPRPISWNDRPAGPRHDRPAGPDAWHSGKGKDWGGKGCKNGKGSGNHWPVSNSEHRGSHPRDSAPAARDAAAPWQKRDHDRGAHDRGHQDKEQPDRGNAEYCAVRVFIKQLDFNIDWKGLKDLCRQYGTEPKHVAIMQDKATGKSKGSAIAEFYTAADARTLSRKMDGATVCGRQLQVAEYKAYSGQVEGVDARYADGAHASEASRPDERSARAEARSETNKRKAEDAQDRRLFCENLAPSVTWKTLKDFFKGHFQLAFADVIAVDDDESAVKCGVVEFQTRTDALEACMEFNGVVLEGEPIHLRQDRGEFTQMESDAKRRRFQKDDDDDADRGRGSPPAEEQTPPAHSPPVALSARNRSRSPRSRHRSRSQQSDDRMAGPKPIVHVSNLDFNVKWKELKQHMEEAGEVVHCEVFEDGTGQVEYASFDDIDVAMDSLQDSVVGKRAIVLEVVA